MSVLAGLKVVELSNEYCAFAGKLLGDMGADVVLVEPPGGDPSRTYPPFFRDEEDREKSLYFWHYNTSKRGVVLDLDDADDLARLKALILEADILVESEPVSRLSALGLDYEQTHADNPGLIHVALTPYGRKEPMSDLPQTDLTLMAAGGPPWNCGYDDHLLPPVRGWGNQGYHTGCHFAVMSMFTALLARLQTGRGQFIDISMTAALNVTTEAGSYSWLINQTTVERQTGRHAATQPTGETQMRCADGRWVNTGVPPRFPAEFAKLLNWMADLGLVESFPEAVFLEMGANWQGPFDLSQIGTDDTITAIFMAGREGLQTIAATVSAQDFFEGCQSAGLAVGVINSPEEALEDPHFIAHGMKVPVRHEELDETVIYPGAPFVLPAAPWRISRPAPKVGEHNEEIFAIYSGQESP